MPQKSREQEHIVSISSEFQEALSQPEYAHTYKRPSHLSTLFGMVHLAVESTADLDFNAKSCYFILIAELYYN